MLTKGLTLCEQGTEVFDPCLRGIWKTEVRAASVFSDSHGQLGKAPFFTKPSNTISMVSKKVDRSGDRSLMPLWMLGFL